MLQVLRDCLLLQVLALVFKLSHHIGVWSVVIIDRNDDLVAKNYLNEKQKCSDNPQTNFLSSKEKPESSHSPEISSRSTSKNRSSPSAREQAGDTHH